MLQAFIENSNNTHPDSLDMSMDADSDGEIQSLELGEQIWANGKLISLDANNRGLSGGIPEDIGNLDSLSFLYLSDNYLSGDLPSGIYDLLKLESLHLSGNLLSGEIFGICILLDNWGIDGNDETKSYIDNNKFCPGEGVYPDLPMVEQDTEGCP